MTDSSIRHSTPFLYNSLIRLDLENIKIPAHVTNKYSQTKNLSYFKTLPLLTNVAIVTQAFPIILVSNSVAKNALKPHQINVKIVNCSNRFSLTLVYFMGFQRGPYAYRPRMHEEKLILAKDLPYNTQSIKKTKLVHHRHHML